MGWGRKSEKDKPSTPNKGKHAKKSPPPAGKCPECPGTMKNHYAGCYVGGT